MASTRQRKAFIVGAVVGVGAGVALAFLNAPQSGRKTRDQIQQSVERVLFRALDMVPFRNGPTDTVTANRAAADAAESESPVDVVIGSRPSETGISQSS